VNKFCLRFSGEEDAKITENVNEQSSGGENGNEEPVTSPPAAAAATAAGASGDGRAWQVMQMLAMLRETRQQIVELRAKAECALEFVQRVNSDRRQQMDDIQAAKTQLGLLHSQFSDFVITCRSTTTAQLATAATDEPPSAGSDESA